MKDDMERPAERTLDDENAMPSRREFVKRIARGSAYVAPMIHTLAVPARATAQVSFMGMGIGMGMGPADAQGESTPIRTEAPWFRPPPGAP